MSHFSVLVITNSRPSENELSDILQPWHEFESTGVVDRHVVDVDETERYRQEYLSETTSRLRDPAGNLYSPYEDQFYRDATEQEQEAIGPLAGSGFSNNVAFQSKDWGDGRGHRVKVSFVPEGWTEADVSVSDVMTFREYVAYQTSEEKELVVKFGEEIVPDPVKHKFGYTLVDESGDVIKVVRRTNPNKKWDWWSVGGRYAGKFVPAYDPAKVPGNHEQCWLCQGTGMRNDELGMRQRSIDPGYKCNGCQGKGRMLKFPTQRNVVAEDQIQVKDIPLEQLRTCKEADAAKLYDRFHKIVAGRPVPSWEEILKRCQDAQGDVNDARKEYRSNPVTVDLEKDEVFGAFFNFDEESFLCTRDEYLSRARSQAVTAFAVVKDGKWYQQGDMGWFGCVSDEKDPDIWQRELDSLLSSLSPFDWITVVDCHI